MKHHEPAVQKEEVYDADELISILHLPCGRIKNTQGMANVLL
jgi:hypothetical protein